MNSFSYHSKINRINNYYKSINKTFLFQFYYFVQKTTVKKENISDELQVENLQRISDFEIKTTAADK